MILPLSERRRKFSRWVRVFVINFHYSLSSTVLRQTGRSWSELMLLLQLRNKLILRSLIRSVGMLSSWKVTSQKSSAPMVSELQCQHCKCSCSFAVRREMREKLLQWPFNRWPQYEIWFGKLLSRTLRADIIADVRLPQHNRPLISSNVKQPPQQPA